MHRVTVETAETGARTRTRQAILDAAVSVLCRRASASLAEVAEAAHVGRTTVHRYFPERANLVDALSLHMLAQLRAALRRARLDEGPGREAVLRAVRELFDLGDILMAMSAGDPEFWERPEWQAEHETDVLLRGAVSRGHADGSIDPSLVAELHPRGPALVGALRRRLVGQRRRAALPPRCPGHGDPVSGRCPSARPSRLTGSQVRRIAASRCSRSSAYALGTYAPRAYSCA